MGRAASRAGGARWDGGRRPSCIVLLAFALLVATAGCALRPPREAGPFREPDLVELIHLDPTLKLDIRYATSNNFLGRPVYSEARAFLQRPAAEALARANQALGGQGYGLVIFDGYRPWSVTRIFWDATPADKKQFVADPHEGSKHNRGCAVDLSLIELATGRQVAMPGEYDEMSERSYAGYQGGGPEARRLRDLLRSAMEAEGFAVYEFEWWHFDYQDWKAYPVLDVPFAEIKNADPAPAASLPLPTGAHLDPAAPSFRIGNMPLAIIPAPAPAGRFVLLLSGWREQGVQVVDTVDRRVLQTLPQPGAFLGLAFSPDGNTLYASGGDDDSVWRYDWKDGAATYRDRLLLEEKEPGKAGRRYPAGLALSRDGTRLYVAENLGGSLAVVDTARRQVVQTLPVGRFPYGVAVAPDGTVWVSAWGEDTIVSFVPDGESGLEESGRVEVGRHPSALLLNADSTRLFVASASTDRIEVVDTGARRAIAFLHDPTAADTIEGSTPNALALSADGRRLFVAEADNNAVAVFDLSAATAGRADAAGDDRLAGRIPCEWYPTALAAAGGSLVVVNGKGGGTGPNPDGPRPGTPLQRDSRSYTLGQLDGSLTVLPEEWPAGPLARMARRVAQANGWDRVRRAGRYPPFKHVLYILKENRTYDQVLSDMPEGDGDPSLLFFPREVTPNHHALAERFGLFDRFFVNAEVSSQGHVWSTAGYVTDYGEKTTPSAYSDRREEEEVGDADQPAAGYLWHLARERGVSYRNYGEAMEKVTAADGTPRWQTRLPGLMEISHPAYPGWDLTVSDQVRADLWIADLEEYVARGSMPGLQFLWLPNDHTAGARPGLPTPRAFMADNDLALGRIIEALSGSPFWKDTVVFVLEDDAQSGPDHVDSHRSILMVISAYNRPGVVHRFVNTTDVLATIEEILGLRSLSQFDHFGRTLSDVFADTPDPTPYRTLKPSVPWTELNPPAPAGNAGTARGGASDADRTINLSAVDAVDDDLFNRVLWSAIKSGVPYPEPGRVPLLDRQRSR